MIYSYHNGYDEERECAPATVTTEELKPGDRVLVDGAAMTIKSTTKVPAFRVYRVTYQEDTELIGFFANWFRHTKAD